jgi:hypothetical protein
MIIYTDTVFEPRADPVKGFPSGVEFKKFPDPIDEKGIGISTLQLTEEPDQIEYGAVKSISISSERDVLFVNQIGALGTTAYDSGKNILAQVTIIIGTSASMPKSYINPLSGGNIYVIGYYQFWTQHRFLIHNLWQGSYYHYILCEKFMKYI